MPRPFRRPLSVLCACAALVFGKPAHAEHLPGGSITYRCIGNNLYEVDLTLWRSCSGVAMVPQELRLFSSCGLNFTRSGLLPRDSADVSPLCASAMGSSTCNGGSLRGTKVYHYIDTVYLSPCNTWTIRWAICCRESSVNVNFQPGLYIEARLNNGNGFSCENSSTFTDPSVPHVCVNQPVNYNAGAVDPTAARRRFSLVDARYAGPDPFPLNYVFPYHGAEPFTGMQIDTASGEITFTPTIQGNVITVVQVDEYNADGVWMNSVMRDFPFVVMACANQLPAAGSGAITAVSGGAHAVDERTLELCDRGPFCFSATISDPDAGQSLTLTTNADLVLGGADVQVSGTSPATITICGNADGLAPGDRYFTITAMDDGCPLRATRMFTYWLQVRAPPDAGADGSALVCLEHDPFQMGDSLGGGNPPGGSWYGPTGGDDSVFHPATDPAGAYGYYTTLFPGCHDTAYVFIEFLPETTTECILAEVMELERPDFRVYPNPARHTVVVEAPPDMPVTGARLLDAQGRSVRYERFAATGRQQLAWPTTLGAGGYVLVLEDTEGRPVARLPLLLLP